MYTVTTPPTSSDITEITAWLFAELNEISGILANLEQGNFLATQHVVPNKTPEPLLAFADGTNWDPGSGKGMYCYYNSAWHFLG